MRNLSKLGYVFIMIIIVSLVLSTPIMYDKLNEKNISTISSEVVIALNSDDVTNELNQLKSEYKFEIIVQSKDFLYSSLNQDIDDIEDVVVLEDYFSITDTIGDYSYVLIIPPLGFNDIFLYFLILIFAITLLIVIWNAIFIKYVTRLILTPMSRLKNNIINLKNYNFTELEVDRQDKINDELLSFSKDLNKVLLDYNIKISEKEHDLFEQLTIMEKKEQYLTTVVHDFRGNLENIKAKSNEEEIKDELNILKDITEESIKLVLTNDADVFVKKDDVNLKTYMFNILNKNRAILDEKEIFVKYNIVDYYISINEITLNQLFTNIINNAIKHTPKFGEIRFNLEDNILYIKNTCTEEVDTSQIFRLDYSSKNKSGIGYGMFRIKQIIKEFGWKLEVYNEDNMLVIKVTMDENND